MVWHMRKHMSIVMFMQLCCSYVSCKLTCPMHLYVCMREGAFGYSQSIVQFKPYEWTLPTRLTVWHPCFDLCICIGGQQCINFAWYMVWSAEALVIEYKLKPQGLLLYNLSIRTIRRCQITQMSYKRRNVNAMAWYRLATGFTYLLKWSLQLIRLAWGLLMALCHHPNHTCRL